jgi:hypothetical protein
VGTWLDLPPNSDAIDEMARIALMYSNPIQGPVVANTRTTLSRQSPWTRAARWQLTVALALMLHTDALRAQSPFAYRGLKAGMKSADVLSAMRKAATLGDTVECQAKPRERMRTCKLERGVFAPDAAVYSVVTLLDDGSATAMGIVFEREVARSTHNDFTWNQLLLAIQQRWGPPTESEIAYIANWKVGVYEAQWEHEVGAESDSLMVVLRHRRLLDDWTHRRQRLLTRGVEP